MAMQSERNLYKCRQWLMKKYADEGLTLVDHSTIFYHCKKQGIKLRPAHVRHRQGWKFIAIRLLGYVYDNYREFCKKQGVSISEQTRQLVTKFLIEKKICFHREEKNELSRKIAEKDDDLPELW